MEKKSDKTPLCVYLSTTRTYGPKSYKINKKKNTRNRNLHNGFMSYIQGTDKTNYI